MGGATGNSNTMGQDEVRRLDRPASQQHPDLFYDGDVAPTVDAHSAKRPPVIAHPDGFYDDGCEGDFEVEPTMVKAPQGCPPQGSQAHPDHFYDGAKAPSAPPQFSDRLMSRSTSNHRDGYYDDEA